MTIDEAIKKETEQSIRMSDYLDIFDISDVEYHNQIAEWLEELKILKSLKNCSFMTIGKTVEQFEQEIRCKAIDDFADKAIKIVYESNNRDRNPQPRDMVADIHYKFIELAEQLKEGEPE